METLQGIVSFRVIDIPAPTPTLDFNKEKLMQLTKDKDQDMLRQLGGVDGIIMSLKTHPTYGIRANTADLCRRIQFSEFVRISDFVRWKLLGMSIWLTKPSDFVFGVCLVYLIIVGIKLYGWTDGWEDGTYTILFAFAFGLISPWVEERVGHYFDKAIEGLVIVLRNGVMQQISVSSLVVGDIALLTKGDKIPADGFLLEAYSGDQSLKLEDDSGEIMEVNCSDPFLNSSTGAKVVQGKAKMMVTRTVKGKNFQCRYDESELGAQINSLIRLLGVMKWVLAVSSVLISVSRYFSGDAKDDEGYRVFNRGTTNALEVSYMIVGYIVAASVVFVAMDTTSFSWALKICYAHAINMMAVSNVIVRSLSSWEKIGLGVASINVIDEFNALNKLIASEFLSVPQISENKKNSSRIASKVVRELIQQGIGLNTTAISNHAQRKCKLKFSGSPRERAFLSQAGLESGMDWKKLMNECAIIRVETLEIQGCRVILVKKGDSFLEHRRGPAEMILAFCSSYFDDLGVLRSLDAHTRDLLRQRLESMNSDSRTQQVIALAYRQVPDQEWTGNSHLDEEEYRCRLLGFVVLKEVDQDGIMQDVIQKCRDTGMDFNMFHEENLCSRFGEAAVTGPVEMGANQSQKHEILELGTAENCTELLANHQKNLDSVEQGAREQCEAFLEVEQNSQTEDLDSGVDSTELGETKMDQISDDVQFAQGAREHLDIIQSEVESDESKEDTASSKEVVSGSDDGIVLEHINDVDLDNGADSTDLGETAESKEDKVVSVHESDDDITLACEGGNKSVETTENCTEIAKQQNSWGSVEQDSQTEDLDNGADSTVLGETDESREDTAVSVHESYDDIMLEQIQDATALSETTISISMGGETTTRTSDFVILDGRITALQSILMWAKCMVINIQAFIQFQFTIMLTSIANALISIAALQKTSTVDNTLMYQLVQQTWVNTGLGLIAAITFGRQRPSLVTLRRKEDRNWRIMNGFMFRNIMTQSVFQIIVVSTLQFKGSAIFGFTSRAVDTTIFVVPIFFQVFNMIGARKIEERNIFSGIRPWFICLIATLMVVSFLLVEILARTVNLERLDGKQWAICVAIALVSWPVGFAAKFVPVRFFTTPVRLTAAMIMAAINRLKELGN